MFPLSPWPEYASAITYIQLYSSNVGVRCSEHLYTHIIFLFIRYSRPRISLIRVDRQIRPSYAKIRLMRSGIKGKFYPRYAKIRLMRGLPYGKMDQQKS